MQTVVETPTFAKRAEALLSAQEREDLITLLAAQPDAGDVMVGMEGVRKLRFAARGRGKSGGARVIYYFYDRDTPVFALFIYGKNEVADLSSADRKTFRAFAAAIKAQRRKENEPARR